ncbi:MAG: SUMF1/EgtB/PvdO family nonheme iron enzyme, partial [Rhodocyclaceae bacterium]|nr:SUMF1/EgtB/PvdO family nonheme iron enzyme [Rhodocyclaceae bacterium]
VARYPVTNIQYQTFIAAGGYADERWWKDLVKPEPQPSRWPQPNRPKTNVDWYEATAFCRWLSAQFGYEIRLPTEFEWEKAARGQNGRIWPWGNEFRSGHANIDETWGQKGPWYLKQTTAVGVFPQDASEFGVVDMAGNVWEWCANKHEIPEFTGADRSGDGRALRGGSWRYNPGYARADVRHRSDPGGRNLDAGFRLFSSAPIF